MNKQSQRPVKPVDPKATPVATQSEPVVEVAATTSPVEPVSPSPAAPGVDVGLTAPPPAPAVKSRLVRTVLPSGNVVETWVND